MADLADAVRQLTALTVTTMAPGPVLDEVVAGLRSAAGSLAAHVPAQPQPRFVEPAEDTADTGGTGTGTAEKGRSGTDQTEGITASAGAPITTSMHASMPYDPVIGRFNPLALPVEITFEPPLAIGTACFTTPYEGGPGWVHGSAIAATFDIVLTAANHLAGAAGPTVWLTVRFRRPTLVGVEARFEAEVVESDGRRVTSRGRLVQDGVVCVEAEGEFAVLDPSRIRSVAERTVRRRAEQRGLGRTDGD
jgi:hypothetical protein